jgi:sRNA-binding protein
MERGSPLRRSPGPPRNGSTTAARHRARGSALSERLFRDFPKVFKYPPVPLAMGSGLKLRELLGTEFKPAEIRTFLQAWTSGPRYLKAVTRGEMRHNLDGSPAGLPAPEHRADAQKRLNAMRRSGDLGGAA